VLSLASRVKLEVQGKKNDKIEKEKFATIEENQQHRKRGDLAGRELHGTSRGIACLYTGRWHTEGGGAFPRNRSIR